MTIKFRMSRGGRFIMYGNPKGYEVAEHIATKVEVNPRMLLILKNQNPSEAYVSGPIPTQVNLGH